MAKQKTTIEDALRLGVNGANLKASISRKRWKALVAAAHSRGFTVRSALSDTPDALKERTRSSIEAEARKTIASTYAPAQKQLSTREAAVGYLDEKRKADDASYRNWLMGETDKLEAQGRAADTALATQQQQIRNDSEDAMKASQADSLQRMAASRGNVSDPNQSKALDFSAADEHSREQLANQREHTAVIASAGEDARQITRASLIAQQGAREAGRQADTWKALADVSDTRQKLVLEQASESAKLVSDMLDKNAAKAQNNREFSLAEDQLGVKSDQLAADVADANRKFRLEQDKFSLAKFTAKNKVLVDQAKLQLGYDKISAQHGQHAADQALKKWITKYQARKAQERQDSKAGGKVGGVTQDERDRYSDVNTAYGLLNRLHADFKAGKAGAINPADMRAYMRSKYGLSDVLIDIANDMFRNGGTLSSAGRAKVRKFGIRHIGYFFK